MDNSIRSHGANSANDRRPPTEPFEERAPYNRPDTGAFLIIFRSCHSGSGQASGGLSPHSCGRCNSLSSGLSARCLRGSVRIHTTAAASRARWLAPGESAIHLLWRPT